MDAPDMLCQIRTGVEALRTQVPTAWVSHCLSGRGAGTALSVHHGRSGASTGNRALHLHQGAADTDSEERVERGEREGEEEEDYSATVIKKKGCYGHQKYLHSLGQALHSREEQVQITRATLKSVCAKAFGLQLILHAYHCHHSCQINYVL